MKTLIVEDDFVSRKILQTILSQYGQTDVAVNGIEALDAVFLANKENEPYDLICLDIQMPKLDGHAVLQQIRHDEEVLGIISSEGVKVIMTTSFRDIKHMAVAYKNLCDDYLVKPIDKKTLLEKLIGLGLLEEDRENSG